MKDKAIAPRRVAVAIPFERSSDSDGVRICLVTSRKHDGRWVLPKGGVEEGETSREAAVREMREEAGLIPLPTAFNAQATSTALEAATVADHKPHKASPSSSPSSPNFVPRAIYASHLIESSSGPEGMAQSWDEEGERRREWVGLDEAKRRIAWRRDIAQLLKRASFESGSG